MPEYHTCTSALNLSGSNVVAVGGTQGIGAGIALRCAELGASVLIIGRNEKSGASMLESLKQRNGNGRFSFLKKDIGTVQAIKEVVSEIGAWAGDEGVDYLFQSQGGASCFMPPTVEVLTPGFNVQILSHFLIPYLLLQQPTPVLRQGAQICNTGRPGEINRSIDFNDFIGLEAAKAGEFSILTHPMKWITMMDVFTREFNQKYPATHTTHLYPGPVATNLYNSPTIPWYIRYPSKIMLCFALSTAQYADIAIWQTASQEAKEMKREFWDQYSRAVKVDQRVESDAKFRQRVWDNLLRIGEIQ